jgi:hypothetical protein
MVGAVHLVSLFNDKSRQNNDLMLVQRALLRFVKNPVVEIADVATRVSPYTHASFQGCPPSQKLPASWAAMRSSVADANLRSPRKFTEQEFHA